MQGEPSLPERQAALEVELARERVVDAPLYGAPAELGVDLRFFVVRARDSAAAYRPYDGEGRLIERVVSD